nr:hypothetical protein [Azospirillum agricola]
MPGKLLGDGRRRYMRHGGHVARFGVVEAILQPQGLHGGLPSPLRVLHRLALPLLPALVGEKVPLLPVARLGDESDQDLHGFRAGRDELGTVGLRGTGLQPDTAVLEIDLLDREAEHLALPEAHQAGQHDAVGKVLGNPLDDCPEVVVGDGAGQVFRLGQPGNLGQLGEERASARVLQPMRQAQGFAETDEVAVDGRVLALPVAGPVQVRRIRVGVPLLRAADIDHDRLLARPRHVFPDVLFGEVRHRGIGAEPRQHLANVGRFVRPVLPATLARCEGGKGLGQRAGAGRKCPRLLLGRLDLQRLLDALRLGLGFRRLAGRWIDAIAGMPLAIPDEVVHPASTRLVQVNGHPRRRVVGFVTAGCARTPISRKAARASRWAAVTGAGLAAFGADRFVAGWMMPRCR